MTRRSAPLGFLNTSSGTSQYLTILHAKQSMRCTLCSMKEGNASGSMLAFPMSLLLRIELRYLSALNIDSPLQVLSAASHYLGNLAIGT